MKPLTVLVVEDNAITLRMIKVALESAGYAVLTAPNGRTALEFAGKGRPDLILQDLLLPDIDGFDLVKQLRELPGGAEVPVLAVSGFIPGVDEARVSAAGFTDFLAKPVEPSHLLRTIQSYLPPTGPVTEQPGRERRVLVVDDDAVQRKLLSLHLGQLGFRVTSAEDGVDALEQAQASPPDAIVSDVLMPRLDGFRFCQAVRENPRLMRVPFVLASSSYVEEADRLLASRVGANAFVARTPSFQEVIAALLASLAAGPSPLPSAAPEALAAEHAHRVIQQLERQAAMNASLSQRCALQATEISILGGIADALARTVDTEAALREVLARAADAGGISACALYLRQPDGRFVLRAQVGHPSPERDRPDPIQRHSVLLERVLEEGAPVLIPSATVTAEMARDLLELFGSHPALLVPIVWRGERVGVLLMASTRNNLGDEDWLAFARAVAVQIGQAVVLSAAVSRLAASEKHYHTLFTVAHDAILVADDAGRIADANPAACALTGYAVEEIQTLRVRDLLPSVERAIDTAAGNRHEDYALVCRGGGEKQVELSVSQAPAGGSVYALRDVTDHRRLQSQYMQSEKLAAMSQMLAGVAHELNNPLTVIAGQAVILSSKAATPDLIERTRKISEASRRCTRIVKNFLSLARQHPPEWQRTELASIVHGAIELFAYAFRVDDVEAAVDLESDLPALWADPHQLHQVLVNLVTNAHHAVREAPRPRRITIATRYDAEARRVSLEVSDTGPGIPLEIMDRLFEPFFTTKPLGQGTGLGLSLCRGIVEGHGGIIRVSSVPGQGATFVVDLPVETPPRSEWPPQPPGPLPSIGKQTILVVDDEPEIADLLAEFLLCDGHQVVTAANGVIALQKLSERPYDLILSDIKMPEMDGIALYRELQRRHPPLVRRFIFISGDVLGDETARFLAEHRVPSLNKPFNAPDIESVIRRVLQAA